MLRVSGNSYWIKLIFSQTKNISVIPLIVFFFNISLLPGSEKKAHSFQNAERLNQLPIYFKQNIGQLDNQILFQGTSPGWNANVNFMKNGLSFGFSRDVNPDVEIEDNPNRETLIWNLYFKGANNNIEIIPEGKTNNTSSYLIGNSTTKLSGTIDYTLLNYVNIYPNIDVKYFSNGRELKYDYVLKPGAAINQIQMYCEGIQSLKKNKKGQLEIKTLWGTLIEELPESYQIINGKKKNINIAYRILDNNTFGFYAAEPYDKNETLIIDPVNLNWSTFVGGTGSSAGRIMDIAMDAAGNIYGTGYYTTNFPVTPGSYNNNGFGHAGSEDVFVFKLNPDATNLIYSTYLGGSSDDEAWTIAVNTLNEVFVSGFTRSSNFPVTAGVFQNTYGGGNWDAFVTKINAAGSSLIYSTFIGGSGTDNAFGIAINTAGEAFITGNTDSNINYPVTPGAYNNNGAGYRGGTSDMFVTKLNSTGSALIYSTFIGGGDYDRGKDIALSGNNAFVSGYTFSSNFPTTAGCFDPSYNGGISDAVVLKLDINGSSLIYSTYLGSSGANRDDGTAIAVNAAGEAFVTGPAAGANFPVTPGAFDTSHNGGDDAFVTKFNTGGTALVYSTFIGGSGNEWGYGMALSSLDEIFLVGSTTSANFPMVCAYDNSHNGQNDVFVCKLNSVGNALLFSTYVGGSNDDFYYQKILLTGQCEDEVVVSTTSKSVGFPTTTGVYQPLKGNNGTNDQPAVFKLKVKIDPSFTYSINPVSCTVAQVVFTDNSAANCTWFASWSPTSRKWDFGDGNTSSLQHPTHTYAQSGTYNVKLVVDCPKDSVIIPLTVSLGSFSVSPTTTDVTCNGGANGTASFTISGGTPAYTYQWSNAHTGASATNLLAGAYIVVVTDSSGCSDSVAFTINEPPAMIVTHTVSDVNCNGAASGSIAVSVTGGTPGYSYQWSNTQTTNSISNLTASSYTLAIADNSGCADTISITVTEPPVINISVSSTDVTCNNGNDGTATAAASGGVGAYSFIWSTFPVQTTANITGLSQGTYTCLVSDGNGCSATGFVIITQAAIITTTVTSTDVLCYGDSTGVANIVTSGGVGTYTYSWAPVLFGNTNIVSGLASGTYTCTVSDANGCTVVTNINITQPAQLTASISTAQSICYGQNVNLSVAAQGGTPLYNYSWNSGQLQQTILIQATSSASYTATVTDNNGCTASIATTITVYPLPDVSFTADDTDACPVFCPNFTNTTPNTNSLVWSFGSTVNTAQHCFQLPGVYSVSLTVTDNNGCINSLIKTNYITVHPFPVANFDATPTNLTQNEIVYFVDKSDSAYSWNWSFGDVSIAGSTQQNPSVEFPNPGTFAVQLIVSNVWGCSDTAEKLITVQNEFTFYAPNAFTPNGDGHNDYFFPKAVGVGQFQLWIFDRWGNLIFESSDLNKGWDGHANGGKDIAQIDTYVWKVKLTDLGGKAHQYVGHINLLK